MVTGICGLFLFSCLKKSWRASERGLHHHNVIGYIKGFGHGREPPSQQPETLSSWSWSSKGLVFNSPSDTSVIYFPAAHSLQAYFLRLWEGTCNSWGAGFLKDPTPWEPLTDTCSFLFNSMLLANLNNVIDFLCRGANPLGDGHSCVAQWRGGMSSLEVYI